MPDPSILSQGTFLSQAQLDAHIASSSKAGTPLRGNALKAVVEWGACRGLNAAAEEIYLLSQVEVPEAFEHDYDRHPETLAESGRYPGNDVELAATPARPIAEVVYDNEYAHAQHSGAMTYINSRSGELVDWVVENYTKPGSKKEFLADPFKAILPHVEEMVGAEVAKALEAFKL